MKKMYNKYFFIPKDGKVNEKTMMRRIGLYIAAIVVCLGAMSASAYAFVTWNVSSGVNVLTAAHFDIQIDSLSGMPSDLSGKVYTVSPGEHSFQLGQLKDTDAKTGYCKIAIYESYAEGGKNNAKWTYFSGQINKEHGQTITIHVPAGKTVYVKFIAEWGTYSGDVTHTVIKPYEDISKTEEKAQNTETNDVQNQTAPQNTDSTEPSTTPDAGGTEPVGQNIEN